MEDIPSQSSSRSAAPIEVSEEMIAVGVRAMAACRLDLDGYEEIVEAIFVAMAQSFRP